MKIVAKLGKERIGVRNVLSMNWQNAGKIYQKQILKSMLVFLLCSLSSQYGLAQQLIPLEVGNTWTYIRTIRIDQQIIKTDTSYSSIEKSVQIESKTWFISREDGYDYLVRDEGGQQFELDSTIVDPQGRYKEFLVFGIPGKGEKLSYKVGQETVTVAAVKGKVITAAGKFKCLKYEFRSPYDSDGYIDTYISPGVGIVKVIMASGKEITELKLIAYHIN